MKRRVFVVGAPNVGKTTIAGLLRQGVASQAHSYEIIEASCRWSCVPELRSRVHAEHESTETLVVFVIRAHTRRTLYWAFALYDKLDLCARPDSAANGDAGNDGDNDDDDDDDDGGGERLSRLVRRPVSESASSGALVRVSVNVLRAANSDSDAHIAKTAAPRPRLLVLCCGLLSSGADERAATVCCDEARERASDIGATFGKCALDAANTQELLAQLVECAFAQ